MRLLHDHFLIVVSPGAPHADRRFFHADGMVELLRVHDPDKARREMRPALPLRLGRERGAASDNLQFGGSKT